MKLNESGVIDVLASCFPQRQELSFNGIGDDTIHLVGHWDLVTTDAMVGGVHFDLGYSSWRQVAHRALAANLSDVAAMGGCPGPFTLALGLPEGLQESEAREIADGFHNCIERSGAHSCWLVGGDITRSAVPFLSITLHGRCLGAGPIGRFGGRAGDLIGVFRPLGGSAAGLLVLQSGDSGRWPELARMYQEPDIDVLLGEKLGAEGGIHACIDLSDGLITDLPRLVRNRGATVDVDALPAPPSLDELASELDFDPRELVVSGGEDYTLCIVFPASSRDRLQHLAQDADASLHEIGLIDSSPGVRFVSGDTELKLGHSAFRHF